MTDAAEPDTAHDTAHDTGAAPAAAAEPTVAGQLLALQYIDTQADQLAVKRQRLPERDELATRSEQMTAWERRRAQIATRLDELSSIIEQAEARNAELGAEKSRLEAQMKTVIAPREAEALMHEISGVDAQRDELDDAELAALEEQSALDDERVAHLATEQALRDAVGSADEALASACADIDAELAQLAERRTAAAAELDESVVRRYESVRSSVGVAVAALKGSRCEGCHLDLSAAEVDTAKEEAAASGYTDCPQCGRLLVV